MWGFIVIESIGILLPSMRKELGLSPIQEGWLGAAPQVAILFLAIPASRFLSQFPPKTLTRATLIGGTGAILFQGWAPVFAVLLLGRLLYGITIVAREPARVLLVKQWMHPKEILLANASIELIWGVGAALYILIPVILTLPDDSWRNTLHVLGGVSLTVTLAWFVLGKERITPEYATEMRFQGRSPVSSIIRYKEPWLIAVGIVGVELTFAGFAVFWPSLTAGAILLPRRWDRAPLEERATNA